MRKFSKRSIAVLTTAAIMASSMSIVAYAVQEKSCTITFTVPAGASLSTDTNDGSILSDDSDDMAAVTGSIADGSTALLWSGNKGAVGEAAVFTVTVTDEKKELDKVEFNGSALTAGEDGKYSITWQGADKEDGTFVITLKDKEENPDNPDPVTPNPTEPGEENTDGVVWVNGKDIKANTKVTPATPASLYKTEQFDQVMVSAGGKWQVAVTDASIADVEAFVAKFDTKGKFDAATAKASKEFASAKIKEGTVTVTAGKKAGKVNVWVYEVKNKTIVAPVEGNKYADLGVEPEYREFEVKMAPSLTVSVADADGKGKTTVDAEKNTVKAVEKPEKLAKGYKAGDVVTAYLCDKKNDISLDATYVLWNGTDKKAAELKEGKLVGEGYTAELVDAAEGAGPAVKITIADTATDKTKIDVQVKCVESGKIAKIAPKVAKVTAPKAASKVTVTFDATVTVKDGTKEVKTGDQVKKDTTLTITPATATNVVSINGTAQDKAGEVTYKITGLEAEAKVTIAAAAPAPETPEEGGETGGEEGGETDTPAE